MPVTVTRCLGVVGTCFESASLCRGVDGVLTWMTFTFSSPSTDLTVLKCFFICVGCRTARDVAPLCLPGEDFKDTSELTLRALARVCRGANGSSFSSEYITVAACLFGRGSVVGRAMKPGQYVYWGCLTGCSYQPRRSSLCACPILRKP